MKRILMTFVCVLMVASVALAQKQKSAPEVDYVDATELTLIGKLCKTTNPYHRVEVENVEGISKSEAKLLKMSSGLAIVFKTNAHSIWVKAQYGPASSWNGYAPLASTTGFNLFIKDGEGDTEYKYLIDEKMGICDV